MNNFIDNLAGKLTPLAGKLGSNRYLAVLRDAFMLSFPLTMFGSIVVVLNNLPFWSDDLKGTLAARKRSKCDHVDHDDFRHIRYRLLPIRFQ